MPSDYASLVNEMYFQKWLESHDGNFFGQVEERNLNKWIVVFMVASLKQSVTFVVKTCPELLWKMFYNLQEKYDRLGVTLKKAPKFRSSPPEVFLEKGVLKICSNLEENIHAKVWFQ